MEGYFLIYCDFIDFQTVLVSTNSFGFYSLKSVSFYDVLCIKQESFLDPLHLYDALIIRSSFTASVLFTIILKILTK